MTISWNETNRLIRECLDKPTSRERISCLQTLLTLTRRDGMVLYRLAQEYEAQGDWRKALDYYLEAHQRFPLPTWKQRALQKARQLQQHTQDPSADTIEWSQININEDTLLIVNCTKTKAWDTCPNAPQKLPALLAYQGQSFHQFLARIRQLEKQHNKTIPWVILSAKHGFLRPCDTIENYDTTFNDPQAIIPQQLEEQARTLTINGKPLTAYKHVYIYTNNPTYHHVACQALKLATTCKRIIDI